MSRIIIVDDSKLARTNLKTILEECGHEIIAEGTNGKDGYELYKKFQPDLIILDITMPEMNGTECLRLIKQDFPSAKIIIASSVSKEKNKMEALALGAIHYIIKPFNKEDVVKAVSIALKA